MRRQEWTRWGRGILSGLLRPVVIGLVLTSMAWAWASPETEFVKLTASDGATDDLLGSAVAIDGDTIVVGAVFHDARGANAGAAYVFKPDGLGGYSETKLAPAGLEPADFFGGSVAVSGDTIVVGAWGDDDRGSTAGAVYVFTPDGLGGYDETKLTASDGGKSDLFGVRVAMEGTTIVATAYQDDSGGGVFSGSAYVFTPDGIGGYEETKLSASDASGGAYFGSAAAVSGGIVVIGAFRESEGDSQAGSAYVFRPDGAGGYDETKLTMPNPFEKDHFGLSVAIEGETVVISAYHDDDGGGDSGSVFVFTPNGIGGYASTKLTASDASEADNLGRSVSISGGTIVAGAFGDDDAGSRSGSAYVFTPDGSGGYEETKLSASDAAADDLFGFAAAISDGTIVVGAYQDDDKGSNSGSVYVFDAPEPPNQAPNASAGTDQTTNVGETAVLDGSASSDADMDALSYAWEFTARPTGSAATLVGAGTVSPEFTPDVEGTYSVRLVVDDGVFFSTPDVVDVVVVGPLYAHQQISAVCSYLRGLPDSSFDAAGHRNALCHRLGSVLRSIQRGRFARASQRLAHVMERMDGCVLRGAIDPSGGGSLHRADYLVVCAEQEQEYGQLLAAWDALQLGRFARWHRRFCSSRRW